MELLETAFPDGKMTKKQKPVVSGDKNIISTVRWSRFTTTHEGVWSFVPDIEPFHAVHLIRQIRLVNSTGNV